jgi:hypothetical protein
LEKAASYQIYSSAHPHFARRVAIVGSSYPFRGGIAAFSNHLARRLQDAGDTVQFLLTPCNIQSGYFGEINSLMNLPLQCQ